MRQLAVTSGLSDAIESMKRYESEIASTRARFLEASKVITAPAVELAQAANLSMLQALEIIPTTMETLVVGLSKAWDQYLEVSASNALGATVAALSAQFARNSELTVLAQASFSRIEWSSVGKLLIAEEQRRKRLNDTLVAFSKSYSSVANSFGLAPHKALEFPPVVLRMLSVEFFTNARLVKEFSVEEKEIEVIEEYLYEEDEISSEVQEAIPSLLAKLNEGYINMWDGAISALESANPDKIRHFAISIRELFTQILHTLSPDKLIRQWSTAPQYYKDNNPKNPPTRRARLFFICRNINHGPFCKFIDKDVEMLLEFINLLQRGTHEMRGAYSPAQIKVLRIRAESIIRYLIVIWIAGFD